MELKTFKINFRAVMPECMKRMIMIGLMLVVQSFCCDLSDPDCLMESYTEYPTYSNGNRFEKDVCRPFRKGETFVEDTVTIKGVDVEFRLPKRVCRDIVEIIENEHGEYDCCVTKKADTDDFYECLSGLTHPECKTKPTYTVKYGSEIMFQFDYSAKREPMIINNNVQFFMDSLEVYRKTGTLKFKGYYYWNSETLDLIVRGYCYDKVGLNKVKLVNNVLACN